MLLSEAALLEGRTASEAYGYDGFQGGEAPRRVREARIFVHASETPESRALIIGECVTFAIAWDDIGRLHAVQVHPVGETTALRSPVQPGPTPPEVEKQCEAVAKSRCLALV